MPVTSTHPEITQARQKYQQAQSELLHAQAGLKKLLQQQKRNNGPSNYNEEIGKAENEIRAKQQQLNKHAIELTDLLKPVKQADPKEQIKSLTDDSPFLLFPVKIETRFMPFDHPTELWVRIFPDEVSIQTFEKQLTEEEWQQGKQYWINTFQCGNDDDQKAAYWNALANSFGGNRALWIARQTKPSNWGTAVTPDNFIFPEQNELKPNAWSSAPHAPTLPDKFVVTAFSKGAQVLEFTGNPIPENLKFADDPADEQTSISRDDATGDIRFSGNIEWMHNFDVAVQQGMGMKIPLKGLTDLHFDKLFVLGLKLSSSAGEGSTLIEELLQNHHYSESGFSFLKQGTPTNNSGDEGSGFTAFDASNEWSYLLQNQINSFTETNDSLQKADAQRFAEALGISTSLLQLLPNSNLTDVSEAIAMNTALFPGTLGYFFDEMCDALVSDTKLSEIRSFFLNYVAGRSMLPAIRIGNQPYGFLVTSDFRNWNWSAAETLKEQSFYDDLNTVIRKLLEEWNRVLSRVCYAGKPGDASKNLMNIIGLQPAAVEYAQRIGTDDSTTWNYLGLTTNEEVRNSWFGTFYNAASALARHLGIPADKTPKLLSLSFGGHTQLLDAANVVEDLPLSEERLLQAYDGSHNYIHWLLNSNFATIRQQLFKAANGTATPAPNALLYLLLRFSYLHACHTDLSKILVGEKVLPASKTKEKSILNVSGIEPSKADILNLHLDKAIPSFALDTNSIAADFVIKGLGITKGYSQNLPEVQKALGVLATLPTARLERLFAEHTDLCSHRLDAWITGCFTKRLQHMRSSGNHFSGIYIGAFGWLENLKPTSSPRNKMRDDQLPEELRKREVKAVTEDTSNAGFIHGMSVNHAVTAAIQRSAYLSHADAAHPYRMSVQLNSSNIRSALHIIDGMNSGQTLGALLGYQFERKLHDKSVGSIQLDQYIYVFREKFPLQQSGVSPVPGEATETIAVRNVADGNALLKWVKGKMYPYQIDGLPGAASAEAAAIKDTITELENIMDALGDVVSSESVYQMAQGNFERSAAVLKSFSEGYNIPVPEVVSTVRTGKAITHRVMLPFENSNSPIWGLDFTPRANAEKGMNKWIAGLLGDPQKICCKVSATVDGADSIDDVTLADLEIHALDLALLMGPETGNGLSELERRIIYFFRKKHGISDTIRVNTDLQARNSGWASDQKTFYELLPLMQSVRGLIASRPFSASDFLLPALAQNNSFENAAGFNMVDLKSRLQAIYQSLKNALDVLLALPHSTADADIAALSSTQINAIRNALVSISNFGIPEAFPLNAIDENTSDRLALIQLTNNVISLIQLKLNTAQPLIDLAFTDPLPADPKELQLENTKRQTQLYNAYTEAVKLLCGNNFQLLPMVRLNNAAELQSAINNSDQLLRYHRDELGNDLIVDEWLQSTARVHPKMSDLEMVCNAAYWYAANAGVLQPLQLPVKTDDYWTAVEFPADYSISGDVLCVTSLNPTTFDPSSAVSGLMLHDWVENIPDATQTTGIAFHYDQPNAMPPQTILVAVPSQRTGHWQWNDLIGILDDTLQRAKLRAVEPDMLSDSYYAQLIPAITPAYTANTEMIATDLSVNAKMN